MFYETSEIIELLNCEHCAHQFSEKFPPKILPCCGKTVCNECVKLTESQLKRNKFKCIACSKDYIMPVNGLQVNQLVVKLLAKEPKEISRGQEADKLKQNLRDLENLVNNLILEIDNGENVIRKNSTQLRAQVNLAKEKKTNEISQHSEILIKKIDIFEEECLKRYSEMNDPKQQAKELIKLANESIQQQNAYLKQLTIDDKYTISCYEQINDLNEIIVRERQNLIKSMFDNQIIKFHTNTTMIEEGVLGTLITNVLDHSKILSASYQTIRLLDLNTGECLKTYLGHSDWVYSVKLLNKNKLVTSSLDKTIKIWDVKTGICLKTLSGHLDLGFGVLVLANELIASCSRDKTIRIWEVQSGRCVKVLNGHTDLVRSIVKLSNERILSGSWDKTIRLWNVSSGECLRTFAGHTKAVVCVEVLSNQRVLSGSCDNTIKVWHLDTGDCLHTLKGHSDWVRCIKVLSDECVISSSKDRTIKIWCLKANICIKTIVGHSNDIREIQVLSDEKVASCSLDNTIKIWDLNSGNCIKNFHSKYGIFSIDIF